MSDFIGNGYHKRVDRLMDILWGSGVSSHQTIIEQINYLMFLRALSNRDAESEMLNPEHEDIVLKGELSKYRWDNLLSLNAEALYATLEEAYAHISEKTASQSIRLLYRNAHVKIYDKPTLRQIVHEVDALARDLSEKTKEGQHDIFGDMYEYLLSKLSAAGTSGQFRTPRHIIKFIVDIIDPKKGETILDPACGTAGFLVAAYKHLAEQYTSDKFREAGRSDAFDLLSPKERDFLFDHTFTGFDSDEEMIKFGLMNLYLHGLGHATLKRQNTLVDTAGDRTKWDVILANPPFSGKIDRDTISEDLQMGTGATEVLFLRYMLDHLSPNGRLGVIVPEGVIFQSAGAYIKIRQMLIEKGLYAVVSLPGGVFNPYAGVKTSILFVDKELADKANHIIFAKVENDGFSLGAQRRPTAQNDLPEVTQQLHDALKQQMEALRKGEVYAPSDGFRLLNFVPNTKINASGDFNLSGDRYKESVISTNEKWPVASLDETCAIYNGSTPSRSNHAFWDDGRIPWFTIEDIREQGRVISHTKQAVAEKALKETSIKLLPPNAVLLCCTASVGEFAYSEIELTTNQQFNGLVVKDEFKEKLLPKYLFWIASSFREELKRLSGQTSFEFVSVSTLKKIRFPLPPLEVQKEIVAELDGYQKIVDAARTIIENQKPQLAINPTWPTATIKSLTKRFEDGDWIESKDQSPDGIRLVQTGNVGDGKYLDKQKNARFISEETFKRLRCKEIYSGEILISRLPDPVGRSCIVPKSSGKMITAVDCTIINFDENKILNRYFAIYSQTSDYYQRLEAFLTGSSRQRISRGNLGIVEIPIPPLAEQQKFVEGFEVENASVESVETLAQLNEQKIKNKIAEVWGE